jgi:hypothetical protein
VVVVVDVSAIEVVNVSLDGKSVVPLEKDESEKFELAFHGDHDEGGCW